MSAFVDLLALRADEAPLCPDALGREWIRGRQFYEDVARLAATRRSAGAEAPSGENGRPVLLSIEDRYRMLVACVATWCDGDVVVLPPNHKPATVTQVMRDCGATRLLDDASITKALARPRQPDTSPAFERAGIAGTTHVLTVYTSGTTGEHQAHKKTASQLFGETRVLVDTFGFDANCVVAATVPAHHVYGLLFSLLVPLFSGARFLRPALFQPADVARAIEEWRVTDLVTVPTHLQALLAAGMVGFETLGRVTSSGGVLEGELARAFHQLSGSEVVDVLGSTESGGIAWRRAHRGGPYAPLAGVEIDCDGDNRLLLKSPFLPDRTSWQTMNDRIQLVPGGFEYLGREDGIVKLGGKRIAVQELEARVKRFEGVDDAAILVRPSSQLRGTELWLAVASRDERWTGRSLKEALSEHFDSVVLPRRFRVVEQLPRDALGKLQRTALLGLFDADQGRELERPQLVRRDNEEVLLGECEVPSGSRFFDGHFPGAPVLPGAAQLSEIVLPQIAGTWSELSVLSEISAVKYTRPVRPGTRLSLRARRALGAPTVDFELFDGAELVSRGQLHFTAAVPTAPDAAVDNTGAS